MPLGPPGLPLPAVRHLRCPLPVSRGCAPSMFNAAPPAPPTPPTPQRRIGKIGKIHRAGSGKYPGTQVPKYLGTPAGTSRPEHSLRYNLEVSPSYHNSRLDALLSRESTETIHDLELSLEANHQYLSAVLHAQVGPTEKAPRQVTSRRTLTTSRADNPWASRSTSRSISSTGLSLQGSVLKNIRSVLRVISAGVSSRREPGGPWCVCSPVLHLLG